MEPKTFIKDLTIKVKKEDDFIFSFIIKIVDVLMRSPEEIIEHMLIN